MKNLLRAALCALSLAILSPAALAQTWPAAKPIRWILPFPPGGPSDNISRAVARHLSTRLNQQVVVENRPGANGGIGVTAAARSAPDGYTVVLGTSGTHTINPHIYNNLQYDALKDFEPISAINDYVGVLVVSNDSPIKSVQDFLTAARANPGKLTYGSSGQGSSNHMVTEMIGAYGNLKLVHVPYKGDVLALTDMIGGQISFMVTTIPFGQQFARQGKVRMLATTGAKRHPSVPELPAMNEFIPNLEALGWLGLFAPAGTPKDIVNRIATEIGWAVQQPDMTEVLRGVDAAASTPEVFAKRVREDYARWGEVVKRTGVKLE